MLASYAWLCELCPVEADVDGVAARLTEAGLEVESVRRYGELPGVVIGEVRAKRPHPSRDKLNLVTVFDGEQELEVVCGAPNVPEPGGRVLFAREGAVLPGGFAITPRKLGGVESCGMICSEVELNIGAEEGGIFLVGPECEATPGTPVEQALGLTDWVLEVGLTPNRPDCLGHVGLARELSAMFGVELKSPVRPQPARLLAPAAQAGDAAPLPLFEGQSSEAQAPAIEVTVQDGERCPRYAACTVDGVRISRSPFWMRYRLHVLGLRAITNAVDITNYVLMEYGYPTHAFDLDLVRGGKLDVRVGRAGEKIVTLDGETHEVGEDDLLICDAQGAVAVAGVMGGEHSGVRDETTRVAVECAYFEPRGVRRTSRRLGLHTDSSHRFERGVDPRAVPVVLARVCGLLHELAGGTPSAQGVEVYGREQVPREITLRGERLAALLGTVIAREESRAILTRLGCEVEPEGDDVLRVQAPTWRPDLTREEDLIEEVARVYGYDRLPTETPRPRLDGAGADPKPGFWRRLRTRAAQVGLTEAVNYAFISPSQLRAARVSTDALKLANPLSEERSVMRTSLLPGLAANAGRAQRHQVSQVMLFELARVFHPSDGAVPEQPYRFGMLLCGPQRAWIGAGEPLDFFDGKGMLQALLSPIANAEAETFTDTELGASVPFLHPRRCARVRLLGRELGVLGELHPDVLDDLELEGPVVYAELDAEQLFEVCRDHGAVKVHEVPRFPASSRDLAMEVDEAVPAGQVTQVLRKAGGALLETVELFDLYRGEQVGEGKKSLAFRLVYRDPEATLTDKRVDKAHKQLLQVAQREFKAVVR